MKTTVDIPDEMLREMMRNAKTQTKREAILSAIEDFNRKFRQRELIKLLGTFRNMMTQQELMDMRFERGKYAPKSLARRTAKHASKKKP